jgi:ribosomal protein L11 methyltransferase
MKPGQIGGARHATALETLSIRVPEAAIPAYEAALAAACGTVGLFRDEATDTWQLEGVKQQGEGEAALAAALALAAAATGVAALPERHETPAEGWLARSYSGFPEQRIGRRFAVRGTHLPLSGETGRIVLTLDAGMAFGSGEHGSTRGCLIALESVAYRRPRRILDLGTGSGILAMGAAWLLGQKVLASDIDPWGVRVARSNARMNGLANRTRFLRADGWTAPALRRSAPYDLIFANILARPLCRMARQLAPRLAPGGTVILSGLLDCQVRWVLAAHRRVGLRLERRLRQGHWATLVLRR